MNIQNDSFLKYILFTSRASMIFILSITLISIGILIFTFFSLQKGINIIQENIPAKIILKSQYSEDDLSQLNNYIQYELKGKVKSSVFVDKQEGLEHMYGILGDDLKNVFKQDNGLQNPLPDIKNIYFFAKYHDLEEMNKIEEDLEKHACVLYFQHPINLLMINKYKFNILLLSGIFSLIFCVISVLLIYNNIKLSIYNNKVNIKAMQLVGATKSFIRRPFLKKSIWSGIQSGILSIIFLSSLFYIFCLYFPKLKVLISIYEILQFFSVILFLGILISFLSTFIVLRKLTSLKTDIYE